MKGIALIFVLVVLLSCGGKTELKVKDRDIISSSLLITGDSLIYATWHDSLVVEHLPTGRHLYSLKIQSHCYAKPAIYDGALIFPYSNGELRCISLTDHSLRWTQPLLGRCSEFHLSGNHIIANMKDEGLIGIDADNGERLFHLPHIYGGKCSLPDISPYRMTVDNKNFYVCDWQCVSFAAYSHTNGHMVWQNNSDTTSTVGNCILIDKLLFLGKNQFYESGSITLISPVNGKVIFEKKSLFEENFNPIIYGNRVYYFTYDNKLHAFDPLKLQDTVVLVFNQQNNISGRQAFLFEDSLYFNGADGGLYWFQLKSNKLTKLIDLVKDMYGITRVNGKLEIIY